MKPPVADLNPLELYILLFLFVVVSGVLWWSGVLPYIDAFARLWAPMGLM